ncbi:MAG: hypothetical protein C0467_16360 [Planctomycetaceae bacterium]|nr:hypothetical protein [Planctomycetaceae bacterium]
MLRLTRLFIGSVVVLFGGSILAQPPKDTTAPNAEGYFPIKLKTKWTYKVQDQNIEVVVSGNEKVGTEDCTKVDTMVNGKVVASELYVIRGDGVYRVKVKDDKIDPPVKVLQIPVKKGESWEVKSKVGTQTVAGTFKVKEDKEKVKVMDKEVEAVLVEGLDLDVAGTKTTVRMWFVKDKGIVKLSYKIQDAESVLELSKFESPGAMN